MEFQDYFKNMKIIEKYLCKLHKQMQKSGAPEGAPTVFWKASLTGSLAEFYCPLCTRRRGSERNRRKAAAQPRRQV